jgi:VIT1/CCC1 family predicted Fe2+/Mn2+ transporter
LNPDELGSPAKAAFASFVAFAAGAVIPLAPYIFAPPSQALTVSTALTGVALFSVGALLSLFTGRRAMLGGLRMLAIGGMAGAATYFIGHALGVTLG